MFEIKEVFSDYVLDLTMLADCLDVHLENTECEHMIHQIEGLRS